MKNLFKKPLAVYCVFFGHSEFITSFFGYQYCGRCGVQIGDTLGGVGVNNVIGIDEYHSRSCKSCNKVRKNWSNWQKVYKPYEERFLRWFNK